ncbi:unnamed protein product [Soboliphyme baturini]|uniref:EGF-like domain-containing protein n=1 Tax=Soboliphyme baturini TaxID=241478 RepID=A0A183IVB2_9BILA|nr:unnamed protein product [Soboliphyme baturini]
MHRAIHVVLKILYHLTSMPHRHLIFRKYLPRNATVAKAVDGGERTQGSFPELGFAEIDGATATTRNRPTWQKVPCRVQSRLTGFVWNDVLNDVGINGTAAVAAAIQSVETYRISAKTSAFPYGYGMGLLTAATLASALVALVGGNCMCKNGGYCAEGQSCICANGWVGPKCESKCN